MNLIKNIGYIRVLLWRDLLVIKNQYMAMMINLTISLITFNILYGIIGAHLGMNIKHVGDIFVGTFIGSLIFIMYSRALVDITDRTFTHFFSYRRSLAMNIQGFLGAMIISYWLNGILMSFPFLIAGMIWLYAYGIPLIVNPLLLFLIYSFSMLFIALLFVALVGTVSYGWFRIHVWQRLLTPLSLLGCQFYSWHKAYAVWPSLSYLIAFSPISWANEGLRSSLFGTQAYLSSYFCLMGLLCINSFLIWYIFNPMIRQQEWI